MPCHTGTSTDCTELMDYVAWDKVNVITTKSDSCISDTLSSQLVQFSLFNPLNTLKNNRAIIILYAIRIPVRGSYC